MQLDKTVGGAIAVVVIVILLTALAPTIHDNTSSAKNSTGGTVGVTGPLLNVSETAKPIYNLTDLLWAALVIIVVVGFGYRAVKGKD